MNFFSRFSIKIKITAGFALVQIILLAVAVSAIMNLSSTQRDVEVMAKGLQPTLMHAGELEYFLERANGALGHFLLSHDNSHKSNYRVSIKRAERVIKKLLKLDYVQKNEEVKQEIHAIEKDVKKFKGFKKQMFDLAKNRMLNMPAIKLSEEQLQPLSSRILESINEILADESQRKLIRDSRELLFAFADLRFSQTKLDSAIQSYLASRDEEKLTEIELLQKKEAASIRSLNNRTTQLSEDQVQAFVAIVDANVGFNQVLGRVIQLHSSERWRSDTYIVRSEISPLMESVSEKIHKLVISLRIQSKTTSTELVDQASKTTTLVVVLLVVGLLLGFTIAWMITRLIVAPINQALDAMNNIASGEGDLTQRLNEHGQDEISQLAHAFNRFAGMVQNMIQQISSGTSRLADEAQRLTVVTRETSMGADAQQKETDQVATAVNEMAATGQEVARNTVSAAEAANMAKQSAEKGFSVVGQTMDAIDNLASEIEKASDVINKLEKDADEIGSVLDVIKGIAEQTNLLALNAAIEAARAGEQGRGFAVVADEVRTLASRTQQSTSEIESMIERLQLGARQAVNVMEHSKKKAASGVGEASKAGSSLEDITAAVKSISDLNTQIASAAEEQNAVAEEINRKVVNIAEVTDQTTAGAQQTSSSSNELNNLAGELRTIVNQFKV